MEARNYFNDEDNNIIRIKQNLSKYKPKQQNVAEKRALTVDEIRNVFNISYTGIKVRGMDNRRDLAKDCFMLSFCLMGMNSADLYIQKDFAPVNDANFKLIEYMFG